MNCKSRYWYALVHSSSWHTHPHPHTHTHLMNNCDGHVSVSCHIRYLHTWCEIVVQRTWRYQYNNWLCVVLFNKGSVFNTIFFILSWGRLLPSHRNDSIQLVRYDCPYLYYFCCEVSWYSAQSLCFVFSTLSPTLDTLRLPQLLETKTVRRTHNSVMGFNPSAWGHLNPSSYCDVGRLFYGVFKLWSKLQRKKWRNNF